jgi:REP element-mobilizing transposase RayT
MQHRPQRKPTRLPHYDYSMPGAYFITACTKSREFLFETNDTRLAIESAWNSLVDVFENIELGEFVVMPNHIHGIIWILGEGCYRIHPGTWKNDDNCSSGQLPTATKAPKFETISNIVGAFKTTAATRVNKLRGMIGVPVWQKSFHDRIVRNNHELECIQQYIRNNPVKWAEDRDNPSGLNFEPPAKSINDYWNEIFDLQM